MELAQSGCHSESQTLKPVLFVPITVITDLGPRLIRIYTNSLSDITSVQTRKYSIQFSL